MSEDAPLVWWQVRDFYYALPWSEHQDAVAVWLRQKGCRKRLEQILSAFEVDEEVHFRKSRKQVLVADPEVDEAWLHQKS